MYRVPYRARLKRSGLSLPSRATPSALFRLLCLLALPLSAQQASPPVTPTTSLHRFLCSQGRQPDVPCLLTLAPRDPRTPMVSGSTPNIIDVPVGVFDLRATGDHGLAMARNLTITIATEDLWEDHTKPVRIFLEPGGTIAITDTSLPPASAVQVLSLRTGRIDTVFVNRETELPFPSGDAIAIGSLGPHLYAGVTTPFMLRAEEHHEIRTFHKPQPGTSDVLLALEYGPTAEAERAATVTFQGTEREQRPRRRYDRKRYEAISRLLRCACRYLSTECTLSGSYRCATDPRRPARAPLLPRKHSPLSKTHRRRGARCHPSRRSGALDRCDPPVPGSSDSSVCSTRSSVE